VVHGKRSLLSKMPGDRWQQFANLRLLYTCMYTFPGKKLLFMGNEFGVNWEWDHNATLDWGLLDYPEHAGLLALVADLNRLYRQRSELHRHDFQREGFEWIDCHDATQSLLCYRRCDGDNSLVMVLNFTPVPRYSYRVGVPGAGPYHELFNSDSRFYGGSDLGNGQGLNAQQQPWMNQPCSLALDVPPLGGVILAPGLGSDWP
jgi:1,4-alpha-glucan branching enzyme